ncbi:MAG: hypothetical protein IKB73_00545 [Ruminococcus sp.]|nr:hypothetical protein [Ruminococcus sp.]
MAVIISCFLIFASVISVGAIDEKYKIDELGLSLKVPKEYTTITRTTEESNEAFKTLSLDYNETMTAFYAADIYLQSVSSDQSFKITLAQTSDDNSKAINNYSDLSTSQRETILNAFLADDMYTNGVLVKHHGYSFLDLSFTQHAQSGVIYGYQCHTVVNGMNINLTLQKNDEELTQEEIKIVTNVADSIDFGKIKSGGGFDWLRLFIWVLVIIILVILGRYFYKMYKVRMESKKPQRRRREREESLLTGIDVEEKPSEPVRRARSVFDDLGLEGFDDDFELHSFEDSLGYDADNYGERYNTDFDSFDVSVHEEDELDVMSLFEDSDVSEKESSDYFTDYFTQDEDILPEDNSVLGNATLKTKSFFKHLGYFFKNLFSMVSSSERSKRKRK